MLGQADILLAQSEVVGYAGVCRVEIAYDRIGPYEQTSLCIGRRVGITANGDNLQDYKDYRHRSFAYEIYKLLHIVLDESRETKDERGCIL